MTARRWAAVGLGVLALLLLVWPLPALLTGQGAPSPAYLLAPLFVYAARRLWQSGEEEKGKR